MSKVQKREKRKPAIPLRKALSTAVLVAGLAAMPSYATVLKSDTEPKLLSSKSKKKAKVDPIPLKMQKSLTKSIHMCDMGDRWTGPTQYYSQTLLPLKTTTKIVHSGDPLFFTSLFTRPNWITKIGTKYLSLSDGSSFRYNQIYVMGECLLCYAFMAQKRPDGSAKIYLTTPRKYAP